MFRWLINKFKKEEEHEVEDGITGNDLCSNKEFIDKIEPIIDTLYSGLLKNTEKDETPPQETPPSE